MDRGAAEIIKPDRGHPVTRCKGKAAEREREAFLSFGAGVNTLCTPVILQRRYQIMLVLQALHTRGACFLLII